MNCKKCSSKRILYVTAKCSDTFAASIGETEYSGYVPVGLGIGGGDYVNFCLCLNCGQIQGTFPLPNSSLELDVSDEDIKEFYLNYIGEGSNLNFQSKHFIIKESKVLSLKFSSFVEKFLETNSSKIKMLTPRVDTFIKMYRDNDYYLEGVE